MSRVLALPERSSRTAHSAVAVRDVLRQPPADWDRLTVEPEGGHVLQSQAWAEHRRGQGWPPRYVRFSDDRCALVLMRRQPPLPGFLAYAPRGPIAAGDPVEQVAARAVALAKWLRREGATLLVVDPQLDASPRYRSLLTAAGYRETEEIQPSRHRLVLPLPPGTSKERLLGGLSKQTRQRIRAAERGGTVVKEDPGGTELEAFGRIIDAVAERKGFEFAAERGFVDWWRRVLAARQARFFVARSAGGERGSELLGGLLVYLQAGHYATAFSADRADTRRGHPGTMHALRWRVITEALASGAPAVDLGGVDIVGHRTQPAEGDPTWGLFQHKASFGARWVASEAAQRVLFRPWVYRAGVAARAARRVLGRRGGS